MTDDRVAEARTSAKPNALPDRAARLAEIHARAEAATQMIAALMPKEES